MHSFIHSFICSFVHTHSFVHLLPLPPGDAKALRNYLSAAALMSAEYPVVISKFILNAKEIEYDGVANAGNIINYGISEHASM
jgi:hypothetical protein